MWGDMGGPSCRGPGLGPRARVLEPLPVSDLLLPLLCPPRLLLPTTTTPRTCLTTSDQCWLVANSRYSTATRRAPSSPPRASAARARRSTCRRSPSSPSLLGGPEKAQAGLHVSRLAAQPRGLGSSLSDRSPRSAPQRAGIPGRSTQTRTRACGPSAAATQRTYTRLGSAHPDPPRGPAAAAGRSGAPEEEERVGREEQVILEHLGRGWEGSRKARGRLQQRLPRSPRRASGRDPSEERPAPPAAPPPPSSSHRRHVPRAREGGAREGRAPAAPP